MKFNDLARLVESTKQKIVRYYHDMDKKRIAKELYTVNGILHREDGPASISYDWEGKVQHERWYKNGKQHRLDGPSYIDHSSNYKKYHINGVEYTKKQFDEYVKDMDKDQLDMLGDLGQTFD